MIDEKDKEEKPEKEDCGETDKEKAPEKKPVYRERLSFSKALDKMEKPKKDKKE